VGNYGNYWESPSLKKGDLGGFENLQGEVIYGKRYNFSEHNSRGGCSTENGKRETFLSRPERDGQPW
jgi:hypothetical protein